MLATSAGLDIHDWSSDYRSPYWFHDFAIDFSVPSLRQVPPGRVLVAPLQFLYIDSYHLCPMRHYGPLQYVRMIWHSDPRCMECTKKKVDPPPPLPHGAWSQKVFPFSFIVWRGSRPFVRGPQALQGLPSPWRSVPTVLYS